MRIEITLKNYRCFPDKSPARIVVDDGWTAFLGVNNAGKSTLLRFFYEFRPLFAALSDHTGWTRMVAGNAFGPGYGNSVKDAKEILHNGNERPLSVEFCVSHTTGYSNSRAPDPTKVTFEVRHQEPTLFHLTQVTFAGKEFPLGPGVGNTTDTTFNKSNMQVDLIQYLDAMKRLKRTFYVGAFRNILNTGAKADYFDIQVGDAFIHQWKSMQTGNIKRENISTEDVVRAIERLFGYQRLTIQASNDNNTLQVTIDRQPYKLHELGAGLAQFIMVLANVAVARPGYILIDEPELHLHPSLQLDFLSSLGAFAEYGLMFTTHSIGLARAAADRIYSVQRVSEGVSKVVPYEITPNLPEFLGALSYSSYQAIGFSKVLLVEGPSEVRTFQQFLRWLEKDHKILLIPLGGASSINGHSEYELSELKRITSELHTIIDSEKNSANARLAADRAAFKETCDKLDIHCHVLERRATDNYLTDAAIKQVKGDKYRQLTPFEALKEVSPAWGKNENWRIASEMKWEDIKDTDLGKFLESL